MVNGWYTNDALPLEDTSNGRKLAIFSMRLIVYYVESFLKLLSNLDAGQGMKATPAFGTSPLWSLPALAWPCDRRLFLRDPKEISISAPGHWIPQAMRTTPAFP